jgi:hypothetical protein
MKRLSLAHWHLMPHFLLHIGFFPQLEPGKTPDFGGRLTPLISRREGRYHHFVFYFILKHIHTKKKAPLQKLS